MIQLKLDCRSHKSLDGLITATVIGWFVRFCLRLQQFSLYWIRSVWVKVTKETKWKRSKSFDSKSVDFDFLLYDAANILRHNSLNLSIARTLLQAEWYSEHLSALRQKCEVKMTPALCSDIILNFRRLALRLNHLSLHQLKRNFKIVPTILHVVKKAVVI